MSGHLKILLTLRYFEGCYWISSPLHLDYCKELCSWLTENTTVLYLDRNHLATAVIWNWSNFKSGFPDKTWFSQNLFVLKLVYPRCSKIQIQKGVISVQPAACCLSHILGAGMFIHLEEYLCSCSQHQHAEDNWGSIGWDHFAVVQVIQSTEDPTFYTWQLLIHLMRAGKYIRAVPKGFIPSSARFCIYYVQICLRKDTFCAEFGFCSFLVLPTLAWTDFVSENQQIQAQGNDTARQKKHRVTPGSLLTYSSLAY